MLIENSQVRLSRKEAVRGWLIGKYPQDSHPWQQTGQEKKLKCNVIPKVSSQNPRGDVRATPKCRQGDRAFVFLLHDSCIDQSLGMSCSQKKLHGPEPGSSIQPRATLDKGLRRVPWAANIGSHWSEEYVSPKGRWGSTPEHPPYTLNLQLTLLWKQMGFPQLRRMSVRSAYCNPQTIKMLNQEMTLSVWFSESLSWKTPQRFWGSSSSFSQVRELRLWGP